MMEDFEAFCKKQLDVINRGAAARSGWVSAPDRSVSVVQFHGVAVLSPLITVERREEMQQYRKKAVELDVQRQNSKRKTLLSRVQEILDTVQVKTLPKVNLLPSTESEAGDQSPDTRNMNGFAILPNVLNLPKLSTQNGSTKMEQMLNDAPLHTKQEAQSHETNFSKEANDCLPLNHPPCPVTSCTKAPSSEKLASPPSSAQEDPAQIAPDPYVMSLQNLLKKSREYIEREQSRRSLKNASRVSSNESHSDKENDTIKISNSLKEKARLLNRSRSCSPSMADKPTLNKSNTLLQAASSQSVSSATLSSFSKVDIPLRPGTPSGLDSESDEELKNSSTMDYECSFVKSLTGSYAKLPSPEPSLSPKMHRRRPRNSSAGHIVINKPINAYDLSPKDKGKTMDLTLPETTEKTCLSEPGPVHNVCTAATSSVRASVLNSLVPANTSPLVSASSSGNIGTNLLPVPGGSPACPPNGNVPEPGNEWSQPADPPAAGTQNGNKPSVETVKRNSPVELNKSYDVETPSPILLQSNLTTQTTDTPDVSSSNEPLTQDSFQVKRRLDLELDSTHPEMCAATSEQEKRRLHELCLHTSKKDVSPTATAGVHVKKKMLTFEEMRKKLEEQHAQQLSLLIAEQEREQERLQKEFDEEDRKLRFQDVEADDVPESLDGCWMTSDWRERSGSLSAVVPGHCSGSTVESTASPSQHSCSSTSDSSFALWGPTASGVVKKPAARSKGPARTRWSQVYSSSMQSKFNKFTALAKGFLTRRIMQTEKLRSLKQTVKDTAEFMRTFQKEVPQSRGAVSLQDASLHDRVLAQLRAALYEIHDIFFAIDTKERMNILVHDRELRREKLIRQLEKVKSPRERVSLSSATQKSLDRKKHSRAAEIGLQNKKFQLKSKASDTRILQPNQGQNAPINKLLSRQGSICKKNPKKEAKCCDNLRRQHSLG